MAEKIMPHNDSAEKAVLGSMILSKYALQRGIENLSEELFYLDAHQKIFSALSELADNNRAIDMTTLTDILVNKNWLKQVGDIEYLTELFNAVPTAYNIDEYIDIVNEKAIRRRLISAGTEIVDSAYQIDEELTTTLDNAERKVLSVVKTRQGTEFKSIQDVVLKAQLDLEKLSQNKGEVTGLATNFYEIDKVTSGLHPNELIIIAARPAMGKTAFALNLATNIAINNKKTVALFNLEMGAEQLVNRMFSSLGQVEGNKIKSGYLEHNDWKRIEEAVSLLAKANIFIDDTPGISIGEIRAKCRRLASSEKGLDLVVIDYLQLITGSAKYAGNRQQEIAEISRSLKTLAMELNIPIIALAQLSRDVEKRQGDKRPILSDLRESGSIEQDADIVSFLYRDDYYNKNGNASDSLEGDAVPVPTLDPETSISEFIIAKHRNGPTCTINLLFKKNTSTFIDIEN